MTWAVRRSDQQIADLYGAVLCGHFARDDSHDSQKNLILHRRLIYPARNRVAEMMAIPSRVKRYES